MRAWERIKESGEDVLSKVYHSDATTTWGDDRRLLVGGRLNSCLRNFVFPALSLFKVVFAEPHAAVWWSKFAWLDVFISGSIICHLARFASMTQTLSFSDIIRVYKLLCIFIRTYVHGLYTQSLIIAPDGNSSPTSFASDDRLRLSFFLCLSRDSRKFFGVIFSLGLFALYLIFLI